MDFNGDFTEEEQEHLESAWETYSYDGLESLGWQQIDAELWFFGPCKVELDENE